MSKFAHKCTAEEKEQEIADVLSDYIDGLNEGEAPSINEVLENYPSIADDLRPQLETAQMIHARFIMTRAPEDFKIELLSTLMDIMDEEEALIVRLEYNENAITDSMEDFFTRSGYYKEKHDPINGHEYGYFEFRRIISRKTEGKLIQRLGRCVLRYFKGEKEIK